MFVQILPTGTIRNIWITVRRICMLLLGLEGLSTCTDFEILSIAPAFHDDSQESSASWRWAIQGRKRRKKFSFSDQINQSHR